jgi:flagellar hook-associated protein 1 FlgK
MSLVGALSNATSGLTEINYALTVVSQNVSNASTPDYAVESSTPLSVTAGGIGMGVRAGLTTRAIDTQVQADVFAQDGVVSSLTTTQTALRTVDAVQGTPGGTSDLASLVGNLQNAFSTLEGSPDNETQQNAVVAAAQSLAGQVNALANTYQQGRQTAQDAIAAEVGTLNSTLATIGGLSDQIMQLQAEGQSTADLQNQRDASMQTLSQLINVKFLAQPNGGMLVQTASGLTLPTASGTTPFATSDATISASSTYPGGGVPAITLNGTDVTGQLQGGQIGANIALRDQLFPQYQGELDEFAETLSTRFSQQGLTLFTDPTGAVPTATAPPSQAGYVGYAGIMTVNPAVVASPSLVRDGTNTIAGGATGASAFTPNPAGGPAGFTGLIARVLSFTFGTDAQPGVAQPAPATTGLGASGTLSAPYAPPDTLADFATALVGAQASDSAQTTAAVTNETAVQSALQGTLGNSAAVSIDTEMSLMVELENAYGANAKIVTAVQSMFTDLLDMVTS